MPLYNLPRAACTGAAAAPVAAPWQDLPSAVVPPISRWRAVAPCLVMLVSLTAGVASAATAVSPPVSTVSTSASTSSLAQSDAVSVLALQVLQHAGIEAQLQSQLESLPEHVEQGRSHCSVPRREPVGAGLDELLSPALWMPVAAARFRALTGDGVLREVDTWLDGSAGRKLLEAERQSRHLSASVFDQQLDSAARQLRQDQRRERLLTTLVDTTRIAEFVALAATFDSSVGQLLSVCQLQSTADSRTGPAVRQTGDQPPGYAERLQAQFAVTPLHQADDALVHQVLAFELLLPTAAVFHRLSNQTLAAVITFASSAAGQRYYASLVATYRHLAWSQLRAVRERLLARAAVANSLTGDGVTAANATRQRAAQTAVSLGLPD